MIKISVKPLLRYHYGTILTKMLKGCKSDSMPGLTFSLEIVTHRLRLSLKEGHADNYYFIIKLSRGREPRSIDNKMFDPY